MSYTSFYSQSLSLLVIMHTVATGIESHLLAPTGFDYMSMSKFRYVNLFLWPNNTSSKHIMGSYYTIREGSFL